MIAEKLLTGPEYTVATDGETLPSFRFDHNQISMTLNLNIFDKTSFICPSGLSAFQEEEIQLLALKAFNIGM